ncbi:hypothetical protein TTHERM_01092440 (macronuclear) [Tetrahymena thermophila SB210]|uniref:Uncharacterized protein n=1 Tax=Tetrahymena thermophila (strain SB210) TaxID=312017 RepID=Q24BN7_TETTS|nr:hypothetical protein TTHERM_01092440 [Tetrahymena thermophila SB210]EAS05206.2 hypothetical protein TTHERM_01092440 [Tetrahymena thermophila SB210]|eukprot:XP_001025451.2 hypothetical protein TTHERM_01092440 [Tetrahymena thermophila SB210]
MGCGSSKKISKDHKLQENKQQLYAQSSNENEKTQKSTPGNNQDDVQQKVNLQNTHEANNKDKDATQNKQNLKNKTQTNQNATQNNANLELDESEKNYYQDIQKQSQYSINQKIISLLKQNNIKENDIKKAQKESLVLYKEMDTYQDKIKEEEVDMQKLEEKCKNYDNQQTFFDIKVFMILFDIEYLQKLVQYIENLYKEYIQFFKVNNVYKNILEHIENQTKQLGVKDLSQCDSKEKEKLFDEFKKKLAGEIQKFSDKTGKKMISDKALIHQILKARLQDSDDIDLRQLVQMINKEAQGQQETITYISQLLKEQSFSESQIILQKENYYNFERNQKADVVSYQQYSSKSQFQNQKQQQSNILPSSSTLINQFGLTYTYQDTQDQKAYPSSSHVAQTMRNMNYEFQSSSKFQDKQQFSSSQIGFQQQGNYKIGSMLNTKYNSSQNKLPNQEDNEDTNEQDINQSIDNTYFGEKIVSKMVPNTQLFTQNNIIRNQIQQNNNQSDQKDSNQNLTACQLILQYNLDVDIQQKVQTFQNKPKNSTHQLQSRQDILNYLGNALEQN